MTTDPTSALWGRHPVSGLNVGTGRYERPVAGLTTADPLAPATLRDHAKSRPDPLGPENTDGA